MSISGTLQINIFEAKDLPAMDINGKSDPYVKIRKSPFFKKQKYDRYKTKVIKKTLCPTWNERFGLPFEGLIDKLELSVYDYDRLNSNDYIGTAVIPLFDAISGDEISGWFKLYKTNLKQKLRGEIRISATIKFSTPPLRTDQTYELPVQKVRLGIGWNEQTDSNISVDVDASCLVLDDKVKLKEAVHFSNLRALKGAIIHSGDDNKFDEHEDKEEITLELDKVPKEVHLLAVVLTCYDGGTFSGIDTAYLRLREKTTNRPLAFYTSLCRYNTTALFIGCFYRLNETWVFRPVKAFLEGKLYRETVVPLAKYLKKHPRNYVNLPQSTLT